MYRGLTIIACAWLAWAGTGGAAWAQGAAGGAVGGGAGATGGAGASGVRGSGGGDAGTVGVDPTRGGPASARDLRDAGIRADPASGASIEAVREETGTGAAASGTPPVDAATATTIGRARVDTEASARRQEEFRRTPALPQLFVQQWYYRAPRTPIIDSRTRGAEVAHLTLAEAVHEALQHNPGVASQRLTPLRDLEEINEAEAVFDPILRGAVNKDRRVQANASALAGVRKSVTSNFNADVGISKRLRTGADVAVDFTNNRFISNARFQGLRPQYQPELVFSLAQPLLRNFGSNFAYLLIDVTRITSEASRFTYRAQLADFVRRVVQAYWEVVFARENLAVQQQSFELAGRTLHENEERVRVGLLAPVAVTEARSEQALREEEVIVAQARLDNARATLRQLVYLQAGENFIPRPIEPSELPRTEPADVDTDTALATALEQRPELLAANLDLQGRNLSARIAANQLLPRVDFVGDIGVNGTSGDPVPTTNQQGETVVSPFGGSYGRALDRMTSREYYSYTAGVEIEIPIGNGAARSQYAQARIDVSQSELNRRELLSNITLEVTNAANNVRLSGPRIRAARVARELAEENLRNQQRRLEVGLATTKDVLDFQDDLTRARLTELQAAVDYNNALAELARARGTLLDEYSVVIEVPGERFRPWWARF